MYVSYYQQKSSQKTLEKIFCESIKVIALFKEIFDSKYDYSF